MSVQEAAVPEAPPVQPGVEVLFRAHAQELGRYLIAMVRDRSLAEDLLQDTFHDALRAQEQLPRIDDERAWLYGIARHRALRALRRGRRFQRAIVRLAGAGDATQDANEEVVALLDLLERELSPDLRALVLLRYVHGFRAAELAEMTGLSAEAVRQRLARAVARDFSPRQNRRRIRDDRIQRRREDHRAARTATAPRAGAVRRLRTAST